MDITYRLQTDPNIDDIGDDESIYDVIDELLVNKDGTKTINIINKNKIVYSVQCSDKTSFVYSEIKEHVMEFSWFIITVLSIPFGVLQKLVGLGGKNGSHNITNITYANSNIHRRTARKLRNCYNSFQIRRNRPTPK
jgi:hypothetical protein